MSRLPVFSISFFATAFLAISSISAQNSDFESTSTAEGDAVETASSPAPQSTSAAPVSAQTPAGWASKPISRPSGKITPPQCEAAKQRLAVLQGQEEILWSSQNEADDLYRVWSSSTCVNSRRGRSSITEDLNNAMLFLKSKGVDIDQELEAETGKCQSAAAAKWNSENAAFRRQHTKSALAETCMLNMRLTLYGKAMSRLNQNSANNFNTAQAEYEAAQQARLDKIAADKAAYDASQAEWKRRVKLCNQGKRKYCASE